MNFRAKALVSYNHVKVGDYIEGYLCADEIHQPFIRVVYQASMGRFDPPEPMFTDIEIDPKTILRGTGISTEKGIEVFEGDDVYYHYFYDYQGECEHEVSGKVVWIGEDKNKGGLIGCFALLFDKLKDFHRCTGETNVDYEQMRVSPVPFFNLNAHKSSFTLSSQRDQ